jgi:hypothetical protein
MNSRATVHKVHLRGLEIESTVVEFVSNSARLQSQRGRADWKTLEYLWVKVSPGGEGTLLSLWETVEELPSPLGRRAGDEGLPLGFL